jgi:hypothetical protein
MRLIGLGIVIGTLLLVGCGGGSDIERLLVLGGGTFTEAEFRLEVRAGFVGSLSAESFCAGLEGLSDEEAADVIRIAQEREGATPAQEARPADQVRAATIVKEECKRIG